MTLDALALSSVEGDSLKHYLLTFLDYFIVLACVFLSYYLCQWKGKTSKKAKSTYIDEFAGPRRLPIIGNGHQMLFSETGFYDWSWELCKRWGDPMRLWRLHLPMIFVSSYETASELLSKNNFVAKSQDINMFWRLPGGNGLSSTPAEVHRSRKRLLHPGYSRQIVERSIYIFAEESKKLVGKLEPYSQSGKVFDAVPLLMQCSFRIVCRSTFGDDLMSERKDEEALEHMQALHKISMNFTKRIMSPYLWLRNDFIYFNLTGEGKRTAKCIEVINGFANQAIERRKHERKYGFASSLGDSIFKEEESPDWNHNSKEGSPSCYLDMLLDLCDKGNLKPTDLLGELNNYIAAGYDTTALTVAWTLFALSLNPSHQHKIYEELRSIFEEECFLCDVTCLTAAETKKMKHLELCIKETLRMFPTSPVLPRSTTDDMKLKDGRVIPAGTDVNIMVDMIHRDHRHFPNPDQFLPERHLKPIPAFIPFSLGARNCIGQVYAMHHLKVELAYLVHEYIWETTDTPETIRKLFQALLVPADGIHFKITRRHKRKSNQHHCTKLTS